MAIEAATGTVVDSSQADAVPADLGQVGGTAASLDLNHAARTASMPRPTRRGQRRSPDRTCPGGDCVALPMPRTSVAKTPGTRPKARWRRQ